MICDTFKEFLSHKIAENHYLTIQQYSKLLKKMNWKCLYSSITFDEIIRKNY